MFIQAPQAPIMAFHFLFIFWAAVWNPCWKWRDHLFRNQEWEGSALELFKGLQTLLITFKAVFLKALLNELCTQLLFKSIASNKFWSQRLNAKLFISTWQRQPLFCVVKKSNSSGDWGSVRLLRWAQAVPTAFLTLSSQTLPQSSNPGKGKAVFPFYLHFDRLSLRVWILLHKFPSVSVSRARTRGAAQQDTALFFLWNNQSSRQTFLIFLLMAKGSTQKVS